MDIFSDLILKLRAEEFIYVLFSESNPQNNKIIENRGEKDIDASPTNQHDANDSMYSSNSNHSEEKDTIEFHKELSLKFSNKNLKLINQQTNSIMTNAIKRTQFELSNIGIDDSRSENSEEEESEVSEKKIKHFLKESGHLKGKQTRNHFRIYSPDKESNPQYFPLGKTAPVNLKHLKKSNKNPQKQEKSEGPPAQTTFISLSQKQDNSKCPKADPHCTHTDLGSRVEAGGNQPQLSNTTTPRPLDPSTHQTHIKKATEHHKSSHTPLQHQYYEPTNNKYYKTVSKTARSFDTHNDLNTASPLLPSSNSNASSPLLAFIYNFNSNPASTSNQNYKYIKEHPKCFCSLPTSRRSAVSNTNTASKPSFQHCNNEFGILASNSKNNKNPNIQILFANDKQLSKNVGGGGNFHSNAFDFNRHHQTTQIKNEADQKFYNIKSHNHQFM
jgi:hypothetical protein